MRIPDDAEGTWLIPEEGLTHDEALATLLEVEDATLQISVYEEDGNTISDIIYVEVMSDYLTFKRMPLLELLESSDDNETLSSDDFDDEEHKWSLLSEAKLCRSQRLMARLLEAYRDWERTDAKMTPGELLAARSAQGKNHG